ncbi:MAG: site-specific integrase [Acidobacteriaceae bacterium]
MGLYKRGKIWWYWFSKDGHRYQVSTGSTSKELAKLAESQKITDLNQRKNNLPQKGKPTSFKVAAKKWMESSRADWSKAYVAIQNYNLAHLNKYFGKMLLNEIAPEDIGLYKGERQDEGASNRTINMEISTVRMILKSKKLWTSISDEVKMLPNKPRTKGKKLDPEQETKLLQACRDSVQPSLYTAVVMFSNTGLRNAELRTARWSQVDFLQKPPTFTVGEMAKTEGSAGRVIPLNPPAKEALMEWRTRWPDAKPADFIFPSQKMMFKGAGSAERGEMTAWGLDKTKPLASWKTAWRTAKKAAGVECRMHDLRHTFVTKLAETGTPVSVIEDLTGHVTKEMRKLYTHIPLPAKAQAVALLDKPPTAVVQ